MNNSKIVLYIRREGTGYPNQIITDGPVVAEYLNSSRSIADTKITTNHRLPVDVVFVFSELTGETATFAHGGTKGLLMDVGVTRGTSFDNEQIEVVEEAVAEWARFYIHLPENSRVAYAVRTEGAEQLAKHHSDLSFMYLVDRACAEADLVMPGE